VNEKGTVTNHTKNSEISLDNLEPGNYRLEVYAKNNDNILSQQPAILLFEIKKPFWQSYSFILFAFLFLSGVVYIMVRQTIRRIRSKEKEKSRIIKLIAEHQMSALRAQMNPHFIFNCINSIQGFILTNKGELAYDYLSKFSKLMRLVLNYSSENFITLNHEIEIVELYIELEQQRFENKFTYTISIPDSIDGDELTVPPMIMQPYIENAIWHGLMNLEKGKKGHIKITLEMTNEILEIIIEDNGVGREKAALNSQKKYKSKATAINNKRTEILSILSNSKGSVNISDIYKNNEARGTRVIIKIPQNTYAEQA
jgi:LytS/YehU family sensor histidine kinase